MGARFWIVLTITLASIGCARRDKQTTAKVTVEESQPQTAGSTDPHGSPFQAPGASRPDDSGITLPAKTRLRVRLTEGLDSKHSRAGQRFLASLDEPIVSAGRVVIPKGTTVEGHVTQVKSSGRLFGRAYLGVTLDAIRLRGKIYPVSTIADLRASGSHKGRNIALVGGGAGAGAAIGAAAGGGMGALAGAGVGAAAGTTGAFVTGRRNVKMPVESLMVFSLRNPVTLRN